MNQEAGQRGPTTREGIIRELIQKAVALRSATLEASNRLGEISDRILGPVPPPIPTPDGGKVVAHECSPELEELMGVLEDATANIAFTHDEISRLERL